MSDPCDPMDSSPPGSSVHGILQARASQGFLPYHSPKVTNWNPDVGSFYALPNFCSALSLHFLQFLELFMEKTVTSIRLKAIIMCYSPL